jgi:hypothetical protein
MLDHAADAENARVRQCSIRLTCVNAIDLEDRDLEAATQDGVLIERVEGRLDEGLIEIGELTWKRRKVLVLLVVLMLVVVLLELLMLLLLLELLLELFLPLARGFAPSSRERCFVRRAVVDELVKHPPRRPRRTRSHRAATTLLLRVVVRFVLCLGDLLVLRVPLRALSFRLRARQVNDERVEICLSLLSG